MNHMRWNRNLPACLLACAGVVAPGCALTSRSEPMQVRYFTLEDAARRLPPPQINRSLELRLGRVDASGDLSDEMAVRTGRNEIEYREDQRWTEKPEQFLRRGLERALFQERGLTQAYSGIVPTLDVELVELAEVEGPTPKAQVRALAHLHDDRRGLCDETFEVEQPIRSSDKEQHVAHTVEALSSALHTAIDELADKVVQCLSQVAQASKPAAPGDGGGGEQTERAAQP
jgi:cholesterol transport system auxiliary component